MNNLRSEQYFFWKYDGWAGGWARSKTWISRISRYRGFYFSNFYKSVFSVFTCSEYRKLGFQKSETFEHPCFRYSPIMNIENADVRKSLIFKHLSFEYRKHGCLKILDFFRSKFSIFTIGEYRKHGFIKVREIKSVISAISEKSAFSTWPWRLSHIKISKPHLPKKPFWLSVTVPGGFCATNFGENQLTFRKRPHKNILSPGYSLYLHTGV